jgi:hypothetical protein
MSETQVLQNIVDEEIKRILDIDVDLTKKVVVFEEEMKMKDAIYNYYQEIESRSLDNPRYPGVMDLMYRSILKTTKHGRTCIDFISIDSPSNTIKYSKGLIMFSKGRVILEEDEIEFFKDVMLRLNKCNYIIYKFGEYSVFEKDSIQSHANTLIVVNFDKYIFVYHYEPAGIPLVVHPFKTTILKFLVDGIEKASGKKTIFVDGENVCPLGLQELSTEDDRYCVLWSSLWVYILFKVLIKTEKRTFRKIFNMDKAEKIHNIFSLVEYMIVKSKYINSNVSENLEKLVLKYGILVLNEYDSHPNRPSANTFMYRRYRKPGLKRNNKKCVANRECISQNCVNGYCRRPDEQRPRKLFEDMTGRPPKSQEEKDEIGESEKYEDSGSEELHIDSNEIESDFVYSSEEEKEE